MIVKIIKNQYTFTDKLYTALCLVRTKLIFPTARLIRFPIIIRGKRFINIGTNLTSGVNCRLEAFLTPSNKNLKLSFGDRVQINDNVHISALESVEIGDDVLIASHVYISDNVHGSYKGDGDDVSPYVNPINRPYNVASVRIGNRVWLGEGVIVMPGVTIGDGAIIGAHSIVNKNIPANCIAVGTPIRVIKKWDNSSKRWMKIL